MSSEIEVACVTTLKRFFDQIDLMSLEEQVRLYLMLTEYNKILGDYINKQTAGEAKELH